MTYQPIWMLTHRCWWHKLCDSGTEFANAISWGTKFSRESQMLVITLILKQSHMAKMKPLIRNYWAWYCNLIWCGLSTRRNCSTNWRRRPMSRSKQLTGNEAFFVNIQNTLQCGILFWKNTPAIENYFIKRNIQVAYYTTLREEM